LFKRISAKKIVNHYPLFLVKTIKNKGVGDSPLGLGKNKALVHICSHEAPPALVKKTAGIISHF
jgi:hypothetical protein